MDDGGLGIAIIIMLAVIVWAIYKLAKFFTDRNEQMRRMEDERQNRNYIAMLECCEIIEGLGVSAKSDCDLTLTIDELIISCLGVDYKLNRNKITGAAIKTANELTGAVGPNIGGAVAGGLLFGNIGAIIGGMSSSERELRKYLIVNYLDNQNEIKVLCVYLKVKPAGSTKNDIEPIINHNKFKYETAQLEESLCKTDKQSKITVDL